MEIVGKPRKGQWKVWAVLGCDQYGGKNKAFTVKKSAETYAQGLQALRARVWVEELELTEAVSA